MVEHGLLAEVGGAKVIHAKALEQAAGAGKTATGKSDDGAFQVELVGQLRGVTGKSETGAHAKRDGALSSTVVRTGGLAAKVESVADATVQVAPDLAGGATVDGMAAQAQDTGGVATMPHTGEVQAAVTNAENAVGRDAPVVNDLVNTRTGLVQSRTPKDAPSLETMEGSMPPGKVVKAGWQPAVKAAKTKAVPIDEAKSAVLSEAHGLAPQSVNLVGAVLPELVEAKEQDAGAEVAAQGPTMKQVESKKGLKEAIGTAEGHAVKAQAPEVSAPAEARHDVGVTRPDETRSVLEPMPAAPGRSHESALLAAPPSLNGRQGATRLQAVVVQPAGRAVSSGATTADGRWQEPELVKTFASTPHVLEVGLSDGARGWLRVRAQAGEGGEISASLVAASSGQAEELRRKLPGISEYLASESVGVSSLVVNAGSAMGGAPDSAMSFGGGPGGNAAGTGEQEGQGARAEKQRQGMQHDAEWAGANEKSVEWQSAVGLREFSVNRSGGWLSVLA